MNIRAISDKRQKRQGKLEENNEMKFDFMMNLVS